MIKYITRYIVPVAFMLFAGACANNSDPAADMSDFTRIFDNSSFNTSFYPIDVVQTPDGGYLILGGRSLQDTTGDGNVTISNFSGVYILKADKFGDYVSDQEVDEKFVDPIGPLLSNNGNYYFFSMTNIALKSQLTQLDADGTILSNVPVAGSYPLASATDNANFLLLGYDQDDKESVVSVVSADGTVSASRGYTIGAGDAVEEPMLNHFIRNGRQFPFQVGKSLSGKYFFNGFYNYSFSLVFTDLSAVKPTAVQGYNDQAGLNQAVPLTGDVYATSRFTNGDNFLLPNATLSSSSNSASTDPALQGYPFPELVNNAPIRILTTTINAREMIVYASNTRSRQIALYAYDRASGKFLGSKYLGFSNPFEIASLITTSDGGIAVLGTTYVSGRFPRICLFKFSAKTLANSFGG